MAAVAERSLFFANGFVISCGTVSLDVVRAKVLLIRCRRTGEYLPPKGRKDLGESLEHAATRETFEETGIPVQLLPVNLETLATLPPSMQGDDRPRAVTELLCRFSEGGDSASIPDEGTQVEDEDFEPIWVGFDEVGAILSYDDDRRIANEAAGAVQRGQTVA
ncbi:Diadenosine hexaphosphate hydrolase-like protein [Hapsidospora chrysogenum ATCC 11550]|uniref:Diadenosine hexaphosphate hydrolase-like protein n=1 Tax=Hapsidospora chrysogenum (strain ATCC 11550 / CBS 779.69 / DSM 880 / IAM 14645 / JCM 23072 / IMI 49137) TaxID=857340 RepID=A0A086T0J9_HAPC1|nr:Diadenosine hexaphosphate hydrolase-like protein [Hapsidospora chrysogenum ATCC 11550]